MGKKIDNLWVLSIVACTTWKFKNRGKIRRKHVLNLFVRPFKIPRVWNS